MAPLICCLICFGLFGRALFYYVIDFKYLRQKSLRWLGVGLLVWLLPAAAWAAPAPVPARACVRQLGPTEGLSQPFIYCLLQDRQGYLWLGTAGGLVRYDGRRFVTFTTRDGLAENFVTGLRADAATGSLWVQHYQGGRSVRTAGSPAFRPAPTPGSRPGLPALLLAGPTPRDKPDLLARRPRGQYLARHRRPGSVLPPRPGERLAAPHGRYRPARQLLNGAAAPARHRGGRAAGLLLVHPQGLSCLDLGRRTATPLAAPDDPLVRGCLPAVALAAGPTPVAWVSTRTGLLRLDLGALNYPTPHPAAPGAGERRGRWQGPARRGAGPAQRRAAPCKLCFSRH